MSQPLVDTLASAWSTLTGCDGELKLVTPFAAAPSTSAATVRCAVGHFEFRDGARFRVRYTLDSADGAKMLLVEDDVGLRPGFLDDINAFLLEAIFDPAADTEKLIVRALEKAVRMHSRAVAPAAASGHSVRPQISAPIRSAVSANFRMEDHPLAALLEAKRPAFSRRRAARAGAAMGGEAEQGGEAGQENANNARGGNGAGVAQNPAAGEAGAAMATEKKRPENPGRAEGATGISFGSSIIASKTLMKQLQILGNQDTRADGFEAEPMEDDLYTWHVKLYFEDGKSGLSQDLAKLDNIDHLDLEFKFPSSYPSEPPVVRFLSPSIRGGHVTGHGAICMELLTGAGWSPVNSIDAVCIQIRALLVAGNARVDVMRPRNVSRYTLEGALQDLSSIVFSHGWTVDAPAKRARNVGPARPAAARTGQKQKPA